MDVKIAPDWKELLAPEFEKPYFVALTDFVRQEYATRRIYPRGSNIFRAFDKCPFDRLKVVIIGQDPYHGPGQAHGLCFSVQPGVKVPPSLQNIYKELKSDLGIEPPKDGTLTKWAKQGVLMLNTTLTVRAGQANSHKNLGWTTFTDHVIEKLNDHEKPIVFLLWGGNARSKAKLITAPQHLVLEAAHPSPLSAYNGFFGCHHFSMCNDYLKSCGLTPIDWDLNTP